MTDNIGENTWSVDTDQPLPLSTTFMVQLVGQYDLPFAPSGQAFYFLFSTDANGVLSRMTIPQRITADDLPKPKEVG